jgi:cell division septation protein DedD
MPWQNNGDYYCFKEEEIKVHAPTVSGVYGLYNARHQITIGNSANIREALLRHLRDANFRFRRFEPTGFTFEVCPKDSRDVRMQQLIVEYNPITQSRGSIGLRSLWRAWITPSAGAFHPQVTLTSEEYHQKHVPGETKATAMKPFIGARFNRDKFLLAGAICSVFLLTVALFAVLPDLQSSARISSVKHRTITAEEQAQILLLKPTRETEIISEKSTANNEPSGLENERDTQLQTEKGIDQFAAENGAPAAPPENSVNDPVKAAPAGIEERGKRLQLPGSEKTGKRWAVQVLATPDRGIGTVWMEKLKGKGYDAFVVEAEIDGKTWYRVRLGNFKTRRDAETLGALVRLREGFHDAFVANS